MFASLAKAQQLPQYTQYMLNDFVINPAIAGKNNYYDCKSNNRYQWVGLTDAPRTYILSVNGPLQNRKMGLGGNIYTDIVGPTRRVGFQLAYAYHLKINETYKLSFGLSAGLLQYSVDGHKLTLHDNDDVVLTTVYRSKLVPDFGAGAYFYSDKLFVSLAVPQLWQSKVKYKNHEYTDDSKIKPHVYLLAGYKFYFNENYMLEPSVMLKYNNPTPLKIDAGLRFAYQDKIWIGAAFRTHDAITALVGYEYKKWLMIGYSYDITTTNLRNYSSGSHELMLGLKFIKPKTESTPAID